MTNFKEVVIENEIEYRNWVKGQVINICHDRIASYLSSQDLLQCIPTSKTNPLKEAAQEDNIWLFHLKKDFNHIPTAKGRNFDYKKLYIDLEYELREENNLICGGH